MSFWRFSRSSRQSRSQVTSSPGKSFNDENSAPACNPPRYSDLPPLATSLTIPPHSPETRPFEVTDADYASSRLSAMSLGSQVSTPSYATNDDDPETFSISSSTTTLTAPPRYSSWSQNARVLEEGATVVGEAVPSIPEHTFDICGGFKSERWATLRLYDPGPRPSRGSAKGRHPRLSSVDAMLGNVELQISSPQTIKNIELTLRGSIITGSIGEGGSVTFLEQGYALWDRKFGDPRQLAHDQVQGPSKYDGKLSGNWLFPFSIPFPTHVDLSTLHAIYPGASEGPVRFLPELLDEGTLVTPFGAGGYLIGVQDVQGSDVTPFDVRAPHKLVEKGRVALHGTDVYTDATMPQFSPLGSSTTSAPSSPLLEPYTLRPSASSNPSSFSHSHIKKCDPSSPHQASPERSRQRSGGTSMQDSEPPTPATSYPPPQSFLERDIMANVRYELTLTIAHGRFSKKSRVTTPLIYVPVTVPRPMLPERERAYRRREIPPGPDSDPGGWKRLPPVSIQGTFGDQNTVTVHYSLSLAMPLSYARGTVLPCCLTVACDDISALNLFANPRTPQVRLRRSTRVLYNQADHARDNLPISPDANLFGGKANPLPIRPRISSTPLELSRRNRDSRLGIRNSEQYPKDITPFSPINPGGEDMDEEETLGSSDEADNQEAGDGAVWCTPERFAQEPRVRRLYGEINLPRRLQPTCRFPLFNILYHVDLLAPATNAFVPDTRNESSSHRGEADVENQKESCYVYISHFVEITTGKRKDEPTPIAFLGPG